MNTLTDLESSLPNLTTTELHPLSKLLMNSIVYTVPILMVHAKWGTELKDCYDGSLHLLPSVIVSTPDGSPFLPGIDKMKYAYRRTGFQPILL